jgi:hypothetical protein
MSLIRIRRERKLQGARERAGMRTRTLTILLLATIIAIWYLSSRV